MLFYSSQLQLFKPLLFDTSITTMTLTELKLAREKLKENDPSIGLPGREDKMEDLENFIYERLKIRQTTGAKRARVEAGVVADIQDKHMNKTIFICGVPGTGKTAVVMHVVEKLHRQLRNKNCQISPFTFHYINAQHLPTPQKVYIEILYQITGTLYPSDKAQEMLETLFLSDEPELKPSEKKRPPINRDSRFIIIIDELDLLYSDKRQSVFYNLFDWPTTHKSRLILITIANAMDLPERFMRGRIGSRLGWNKIVFEPYTSEHLEIILKAKLGAALLNKVFDKNSILVATKRIGKTTGDARRIIDTCCLAVDEAIETKTPKVTSAIVDRVGFQNLDTMKTEYVETCPPLELIILKAILNESSCKGEDNIFAQGVYNQIRNILRKSPHPELNDYTLGHDEYHEILNVLQGHGLIALEDQKNLMQKQLFIKDTSESFRDVIRLAKIQMVEEYLKQIR